MLSKLVTAVLVSILCLGALVAQSRHTIKFTFDYDFGITPACSAQIKKGCVQQFNFYDISAGMAKRVKLGSLPVPAGVKGLVKSISFTTDRRLFNPGKHMVAVSAQLADGMESDVSKCSTIVKIR
ncbi:MAG: hypothetical protein WA830_11125 [Candidatus Sulfotelmatobacter sp.]